MKPRIGGGRLPVFSPWASLAVLGLVLAGCASDTTAPQVSLVGTWDLVGFSDGGVAATTTGNWNFAADHTYSVEGTITFPGEPTDAIAVSGTWAQNGSTVTLTDEGGSTRWTVTADGAELILTQQEEPPANTITLRRT